MEILPGTLFAHAHITGEERENLKYVRLHAHETAPNRLKSETSTCWEEGVKYTMASQEDGEEKLVKYQAGDKKLDSKDDSKCPAKKA